MANEGTVRSILTGGYQSCQNRSQTFRLTAVAAPLPIMTEVAFHAVRRQIGGPGAVRLLGVLQRGVDAGRSGTGARRYEIVISVS